jgi:hypothetical protein
VRSCSLSLSGNSAAYGAAHDARFARADVAQPDGDGDRGIVPKDHAGGQVRGPDFSGLGPDGPIVNSARCDELDRDPWAAWRLRPVGGGSRMGPVSSGAASLADCSRSRGVISCRLAARRQCTVVLQVVAAGTVTPVTGKASRRCSESATAVVTGGVTAGRRAGGRARRPGPGRSPGRGLPPAVW